MKWFVKCLRKYAVFRGRASSTEFWSFVLCVFILLLFAGVVDFAIQRAAPDMRLGAIRVLGFRSAGGIVVLLLLLPQIAVMVRRVHDVGLSGWWVAAYWLVALAGRVAGYFSVRADASSGWATADLVLALLLLPFLVFLIVCFCRAGDAGPNRYGPAPEA